MSKAGSIQPIQRNSWAIREFDWAPSSTSTSDVPKAINLKVMFQSTCKRDWWVLDKNKHSKLTVLYSYLNKSKVFVFR